MTPVRALLSRYKIAAQDERIMTGKKELESRALTDFNKVCERWGESATETIVV
jgi:hypothetical protein